MDRGSGFGWDNEFGAHTVEVADYSVRKYKVTNGEYLAFVKDGGSQPFYWRKHGKSWLLRAMFGEIPLPLDWPVYVTHAQAMAFADYADASLPSEAQWDRALTALAIHLGASRGEIAMGRLGVPISTSGVGILVRS